MKKQYAIFRTDYGDTYSLKEYIGNNIFDTLQEAEAHVKYLLELKEYGFFVILPIYSTDI